MSSKRASIASLVGLLTIGIICSPACANDQAQVSAVAAAAINDAPSFVLNTISISVREDEEKFPPITTQTVIPNFVQNLRRGPVTARDEEGLESVAAQGLTFTTIIASNPSLFSVQPRIDVATGNLIFHTAPDRSGTSVFVIRLTDDGLAGPPPNNNLGPTATYTINISSVNSLDRIKISLGAT